MDTVVCSGVTIDICFISILHTHLVGINNHDDDDDTLAGQRISLKCEGNSWRRGTVIVPPDSD